MFFAPTARTLEHGKGYVADYYLFFPIVAYGVTDRITVAGGMSILPAVKFDTADVSVAGPDVVAQAVPFAVLDDGTNAVIQVSITSTDTDAT